MATFQRFEDIDAWQKARELNREVYKATRARGFSQDWGLRDQLRRAAVSIMANIAEGHERSGRKEFAQFLAIAKGSAGEVQAQLYVALDLQYLDAETFGKVVSLAKEVGRLIGGLMKYLRSTEIDGSKFRRRAT